MKYCPKCKNTPAGNVNFCYRDGSPLETALECECGRELGPYDKFCENCGKPKAQADLAALKKQFENGSAQKEPQCNTCLS
jgi:hypothetical protein